MFTLKKRIAVIITSFVLSTSVIGCSKKEQRISTEDTTSQVVTEISTEVSDSTEDVTDIEDTIGTVDEIATSDPLATTEFKEPIFVDDLATGPSVPYEEPIGEADPNVDYDLTVLTTNMIYLELTKMFTDESYIGKTIKIKGYYKSVFYDKTGEYYHYVMIPDEHGCCETGVEFIWDDNSHVYPDEYPEEEQEIMIQGVYGSYVEDNTTYYYIAVDDVTVLK